MPASSPTDFLPEEKQRLLELARSAIATALQGDARPALPDSPRLLAPGASFVTLKQQGMLRGCIGTLTAWRPLAEDVLQNARAAAFQDPRFPPLAAGELGYVTLSVSVLTAPEAFPVASEAHLLRELQPGRDGLILEDGRHRATFLPAVWRELPTPETFLAHLKRKAGLPVDYWSPTLRVSRYFSLEFAERADA